MSPLRLLAVFGSAVSVSALPPLPHSLSLPITSRLQTSFIPVCRCRHNTVHVDRGAKCGLGSLQLSAWDSGSGGDWDTPDQAGQRRKTPRSDLRRMEAEVEAEAMARLDRKRVAEALSDRTATEPPPPSSWSVALAAAGAAATLAFFAVHSRFLSSVIFAAVCYLATRDPLDEEGPAGALARILGRWTLRSVETTTPKVKAAIRAAATGEEEAEILRARVRELEVENESLKTWVERRMAVDDNSSAVSLDELKFRARARGIPYSGRTKAQIMMALLEEEDG